MNKTGTCQADLLQPGLETDNILHFKDVLDKCYFPLLPVVKFCVILIFYFEEEYFKDVFNTLEMKRMRLCGEMCQKYLEHHCCVPCSDRAKRNACSLTTICISRLLMNFPEITSFSSSVFQKVYA